MSSVSSQDDDFPYGPEYYRHMWPSIIYERGNARGYAHGAPTPSDEGYRYNDPGHMPLSRRIDQPIGGRPTSGDWAKHRSLITALYVDQDRALDEVIEIMREEHQFFEHPGEYRKHFIMWGVDERPKKEDVEHQGESGSSNGGSAQHPSVVAAGPASLRKGPTFRLPHPTPEDTLPALPRGDKNRFLRGVQTSRSNVENSCDNCRAQLISCDEKRPACTRCVRLRMLCIRKSTLRNMDPLSSDSGYGTISYGSQIQGDKRMINNDSDIDIQTVYTGVSDRSDLQTEIYIDTFVDDLVAKVGGTQLSAQVIEKISRSLPTLLKTLALQIGYRNQAQRQRDVMVFIHKKREAIATAFKSRWDYAEDVDAGVAPMREPKPTEIMDRWLASAEPAFDELHDEALEDEIECTDEHELIFPELKEYKKLILEDPGYMWMLARLRQEHILTKVEHDIMYRIKDTIFRAIPRTKHVSRNKPPEAVQVTFAMKWDIMMYLRRQGYDKPYADAIANSITLTGSHTYAQALTCQQYMTQVWPLTGSHTLQLIQETLKSPERKKALIFDTPCRMSLEASITDGGLVIVTALGLPDFVAEIGEQLAWLCSALQPLLALRTGVRLEMPLELMVSLTGTRYLNAFNSKIFIKGFNTMLVPVKRSQGVLVWHLLHSQYPSKRISYLSSDLECVDITLADLETSRHVLGWCADATSIVGTTLATYNIERSHLPRAHSHHMLEKVELSAGQLVTGTAAFTLGKREKPVHISRFGFPTKLQWVSSKHIVLWDEEDKRGWLVNGASAMLHILRASLAHSKRKFQSAWLLDPSTLEDYMDLSCPDAALRVLIDEKNRNLTLYMDKTEVYEENIREGVTTSNTSRTQTRHYHLEDRIEHIYNMLEKLIDHQTDVERRSGLQISLRPRRQLEGWDFKDLVKDGDPIFPRVATLPTIGKGWVDFTRAIHAVTLFGRGFGDLIQPRRAKTNLCSRWSLLPKESYYLAACVSDLLEIMEADGDTTTNPRRLCENIIWHIKRTTFDPCPCIKGPEHKHHDPVQALFPLSFTRSLQKKAPVDLKGTGAVIFGHNMSLHWHWKDVGDPVRGDPPLGPVITTEAFDDSGLGSSLGSSRFLSASDPSTSGSTGDKSPTPNPAEMPPSSQDAARGPKRALHDVVLSVCKKVRR
ncbi:hypothetical protein NUW58_g7239 [Xylaria curta]|uniref:Uncharacterized protein n=1 Tax=Xylaria curta TaxID=42375 RepID=A0ACC1NKF4_9PEZI|nr:hypothetical protein NUW58_g7239 [Xylaria curta]